MAKFIEFNVMGNASSYLNTKHLINTDLVTEIKQTAAQTLEVVLNAVPTGKDTVTFTASTSTSSQVNPTNSSGAPLGDAVKSALTANPGGVKASAQLGKDQASTPVQMYWSDIQWS
jgi:hypothetical protein|tara:strand:- start:100 stop:447 length:348 start_codon:yes stop_codon:yes gene_type:complete